MRWVLVLPPCGSTGKDLRVCYDVEAEAIEAWSIVQSEGAELWVYNHCSGTKVLPKEEV